MRTHQDIDARSLAMHILIADKIRHDPSLLSRVKATLQRWRGLVSGSSLPYLEEWDAILDQGVEATLATAEDPSEHATSLRQASPFTGILSEEERLDFLRTWRMTHDA